MQKKHDKPQTIEELYPELPPKERAEAQANLQAYFNLVWRIYNRLKSERKLDEIKKLQLQEEWQKRSSRKQT